MSIWAIFANGVMWPSPPRDNSRTLLIPARYLLLQTSVRLMHRSVTVQSGVEALYMLVVLDYRTCSWATRWFAVIPSRIIAFVRVTLRWHRSAQESAWTRVRSADAPSDRHSTTPTSSTTGTHMHRRCICQVVYLDSQQATAHSTPQSTGQAWAMGHAARDSTIHTPRRYRKRKNRLRRRCVFVRCAFVRVGCRRCWGWRMN